jgi:hypothetical protein
LRARGTVRALHAGLSLCALQSPFALCSPLAL